MRRVLFAFGGLGAAYLLADMLFGDAGMVLANKTLPPVFLLLCALGVRQLVREDPSAEWSPLLWFLMASGLYFGFGSLAHYFSSQASLLYIGSFYFTDDRGLYRANLLNVWGTFACLLGYLSGSRSRVLRGCATGLRLEPLDSDAWLWRFALIGIPIKYGLAMPDRFGILPFVAPSSIVVFETFVSALAFLLIRRILQGSWRLWPWLGVLLAAEIGSAVLTFSKLGLLWTCIPVLLGVLSVHRRASVLAGGVGALGVIYLMALPLTNFGREVAGLSGDINSRMGAVRTFAAGELPGVLEDSSGVQSWWTRLDYASVQAFVMDQYDQGRPGRPFEVLAYAFIPRFLWPSKPFVTRGDDLNFLISGISTSKSAPTVFGECYWTAGWPGVFLGGLFVGVILSLFHQAVTADRARGSVGLLPLAFLAIQMGIRPDGDFVNTFIASIAIAAGLFVTLRVLSILGKKQNRGNWSLIDGGPEAGLNMTAASGERSAE
jgi:hypothetical protein